jgi:enoyl-CoA hydratase/carnithine racemase
VGDYVTLETIDDGVGLMRIDHPPVNALSGQVAREIGEAVDGAGRDDSIRSVIVHGGDKVFAAGADIKEMTDLDAVAMFRYIGSFQDVFTRLEQLPKVTIAAVNGYALGGGCELSLACDFRICAENSQFGQPEILLGVIPGAGGTQRLPRLVGVGRAKEIIYSGRFVTAAEARDIGLVTEVVASSDVLDSARAMARRYARGPTVALMAAKAAIQNGTEMDRANGLLVERQAFAALFATEDQQIGMRSFAEKGPGKAEFVGR